MSDRAPNHRFWRALTLIALAGGAVRVAVVAGIPTEPASDSWSYLARARNLMEHGRYEAFVGRPDANFPPGYPLALAAAMNLAPARYSLLAAKLLSCGLAAVAIMLGGLLVRHLAGDTPALVASAALALYPRHVLASAVLLSEHLFLPLLLLLMNLVATGREGRRTLPIAALAGVVTGCLALTRPVGYLLGLLWAFRGLAREARWRRVGAELALLLATQHLVMLPWAIRNYLSFGSFSFLSSTGGIGLFIGNNPAATGKWMRWRPILESLEPAARQRELNCFAVDRLARRAALRWMRDNPRHAVKLYLAKLSAILQREDFLVFFTITGTDLWPPVGGVRALPAGHPAIPHARTVQRILDWGYWGTVSVAGIGGLILLARRGCRRACVERLAVWAATIAYFPLAAAWFHASPRYKWPSEDLLLLLASCAAAILARDVLRGSSRVLADADGGERADGRQAAPKLAR